jgi:hypothetical protein
MRPEHARRGFAAHRGLMAVAAGGAMVEAVLVALAAPASRALAPQVTALAPLAVFHDLRWLDRYGGSWASFCAVLATVVVARTLLDAVLARLAWPGDRRPPRTAALLGGSAAATVLAAVLLSPLVTVAFGVALLPFSWPLLAALPVLLLITSLLSHGGTVPWWWRVLPAGRAVSWSLADFAVLSAAAALAGWLPTWWAVPVAGLAGLFNARAWYGVTTAMAAAGAPARLRVPRPARYLPVAPLAVLAAVTLVIGIARVTFSAAAGGRHAATATAALGVAPAPAPTTGTGAGPVRPGAPAVLDVEGFGSSCCYPSATLRALSVGGIAQQFSYLGLDRAGQPRPYGRTASDLPLAALGDRIASQVWRLHRATGRPVDIVAESEGTLGVDAMLARHPRVPVGSVVLLSPILAPGQVSYPAGDGTGPGQVPGDELRAVVSFIGGLSPYGRTGAQTLFSSVDRSGARYARAAAAVAKARDLRWLLVLPLADALTMPQCELPATALVVPALHGGLSGDPQVDRAVRRFLAGGAVRGQPGLRTAAETMAAASTAWRMPAPPDSPCPAGRGTGGGSS